jgi:hypothetical protein
MFGQQSISVDEKKFSIQGGGGNFLELNRPGNVKANVSIN